MLRITAIAGLVVGTAAFVGVIAETGFSEPRHIRVGEDGSSIDIGAKGKKKDGGGKDRKPGSGGGSIGPDTDGGDGGGVSPPEPPLTGYQSTLENGLTPSPYEWGGRIWRVNAGSSWNEGMDHSVRVSAQGQKIRFELHDSDFDRSSNDEPGKRRAELSGSIYGDKTRLPNGVELWGAFSFIHHPWPDPGAMKDSWGGVYGQLHMGSKFGGSPAFAVRRKSDGRLWITTRGQLDTEGSVHYLEPLSFGQQHDLVYAITLDPLAGKLRVWLDGAKIVDVEKASIGSSYADSYWAFGLYFSGGITPPIVGEYAHMAYPEARSLASRISQPPAWPTD